MPVKWRRQRVNQALQEVREAAWAEREEWEEHDSMSASRPVPTTALPVTTAGTMPASVFGDVLAGAAAQSATASASVPAVLPANAAPSVAESSSNTSSDTSDSDSSDASEVAASKAKAKAKAKAKRKPCYSAEDVTSAHSAGYTAGYTAGYEKCKQDYASQPEAEASHFPFQGLDNSMLGLGLRRDDLLLQVGCPNTISEKVLKPSCKSNSNKNSSNRGRVSGSMVGSDGRGMGRRSVQGNEWFCCRFNASSTYSEGAHGIKSVVRVCCLLVLCLVSGDDGWCWCSLCRCQCTWFCAHRYTFLVALSF